MLSFTPAFTPAFSPSFSDRTNYGRVLSEYKLTPPRSEIDKIVGINRSFHNPKMSPIEKNELNNWSFEKKWDLPVSPIEKDERNKFSREDLLHSNYGRVTNNLNYTSFPKEHRVVTPSPEALYAIPRQTQPTPSPSVVIPPAKYEEFAEEAIFTLPPKSKIGESVRNYSSLVSKEGSTKQDEKAVSSLFNSDFARYEKLNSLNKLSGKNRERIG